MDKGRSKRHGTGTGPSSGRRHGLSKSSERPEFDMKKARYDIIKFAMSGLSGTAKHDAETNLAIRLGAKPPKSTYVNYKELQMTRKKEKEERQLLRQNYSKPKPNKTDKNDSKSTKKKPVKHSLETTGIYKVKFPPTGSFKTKSNSKSNQTRRKGRR